MKIFYSLITFTLLWLITGCSPVSSEGGGSSSEVIAVVQGTTLTENGVAAAGVSVMLIPSDFNAVTDSSSVTIYESESDSAGRYAFKEVRGGIYNIYAFNRLNGTKALTLNVIISDYKVNHPTSVLKPVSTVKIGLPETIDTAEGYIYMPGTDYSSSLSKAVLLSNGKYTLLLDSIPAGELPSILYSTKKGGTPTVIGTSIVTSPGDTAIINIDKSIKPAWIYPLVIGLTSKTDAHLKQSDSIHKQLNIFIESINNRFNTSDPFTGFVCFRLDSLYTFDGSETREINKPFPSHFFQRMILNGFPENSSQSGWFSEQRTVYKSSSVEQLLGKHAVNEIAWQLGLACGCIPSSYTIVAAEKNPVNNTSFPGGNYFMYKPYEYTAWDPYNILVLNYYDGKPFSRPCKSLTGYPQSVSIIVEYQNSSPAAGATIMFFGIKWEAYAVTDTILTGKTDDNGVFTFQGNPYSVEPDGQTKYCNFLIRAVSSTDTAYTWLPIDEVGIAFFSDSPEHFRKVIRLPGKL